MTDIDQFESAFKAADKTPFALEPVNISSVVLVTDLDVDASNQLQGQLRSFLSVLDAETDWEVVGGEQSQTVAGLLAAVERQKPDLICTYRNLHTEIGDNPYSLGVHLDVLAQESTAPVLVVPHPAIKSNEKATEDLNSVMAITDHLTGDNHLVSFGARFTADGGKLFLTHIEDETVFQRYLDTIGKIPNINTDTAREEILERLLKEPRDYIDSCREMLHAVRSSLTVESIVTMGHHLTDYKQLIDEHQVDLLVMNTKEQDQMAMHGLAYPLSVELRQTPLLLL